MNIGYTTCRISSKYVLIKKHSGRYIVHVIDTNVDFLGMAERGDKPALKQFKAGMLDVYGIKLEV